MMSFNEPLNVLLIEDGLGYTGLTRELLSEVTMNVELTLITHNYISDLILV